MIMKMRFWKRKEFESNLDLEKTIEICRQLCRENEENDEKPKMMKSQMMLIVFRKWTLIKSYIEILMLI
ncbi:hypothetical protein TKK_0015402 [Trichogramma kaykai]